MASKLIELNEAAKLLGVTPEQLQEMRQRGDIHGYRDGASWKFKQDEIDRVIAERAEGGDTPGSLMDTFDHLVPDAGPDDDSSSEMDSVSILVSEEELGQSPPTSQSTIIGRNREIETTGKDDSDLKLASESDLKLASTKPTGSSLKLGDDDGELLLADEKQLNKSGSGTGDLLPGKKSSANDDDLLAFDDDALTLEEDGALNLDDDSSDDMVLGGSSHGSDLSLDAAGSGINLMSPADSGLSLEDEPLELAGSQVDSLELPEDDEILTFDDAAADSDQATQLKADEEFLLSPLDDGSLEESSDSGSQVIALEDSEAFDQNAVTMLNEAGGPLLAEDGGDVMGAPLGALGAPGGMTATMAGPAQYIPVPMPETPYSVWNIMGLVSVLITMILSLMLMIDVMRNMWTWESGVASTTSGLMEGILNMLNIK